MAKTWIIDIVFFGRPLLHALKVRGWWMGGLQDFSVSRSPLGTNLSFELGWTLDWTGLDIGDLGSQGFGDRA